MMQQNNTIAYRPEIDALRAIAVMLVILFHFRLPIFPGGFIGVDVFFVISGFLISGIIFNQMENNSFSLTNFFAGRMRRIFPALFFMSLFVGILCLILPVYLENDFNSLRRSLRSAVLFYSNIYFYLNTGYFDTPALTQVFLHTWSLSIEAQFYLVYPFFALSIYKLWPGEYKKIFLCTLVLLAVLAIYIAAVAPNAAFYLLPTRAWELLLGGWLAISKISPRSQNNKKLCIITGLALILLSAFLYNRVIFPSFPGVWALIPCLGAFLYIAGAHEYHVPGWVQSLVSNRALVYTGLISYSLYLWHWPVFVIYRRLSFSLSMSLPVIVLLCAVTVCLAHCSWKFIERPVRAKLGKYGISAQCILLACCLSSVVMAVKTIREPFQFITSEYAKGARDTHEPPFAPYSLLGGGGTPLILPC